MRRQTVPRWKVTAQPPRRWRAAGLLTVVFASVLWSLSASFAVGGAPPPPPEPVITVSAIAPLPLPEDSSPLLTLETPQGEAQQTFNLQQIESAGLVQVSLDLRWKKESGTYQGVRLRDFLRMVGADKQPSLRFHGHDGYSVDIPQADWQNEDVIIATRFQGQPLNLRNKGPLRVIYPIPVAETYRRPEGIFRWIWMVDAIRRSEP